MSGGGGGLQLGMAMSAERSHLQTAGCSCLTCTQEAEDGFHYNGD